MTDSPVAPWLAANLEALGAALGTAIDVDGGGRWVVTPNADGPVLQLRTATGALVAAHSRRQPAAEGARLVDEALGGRPCPPLAMVIGAGLGAAVTTLLDRDASVRVLVIEPDASGAAALLGHRDWTGAISSGRLLVLAGPDFRGVERAWRFVPAGDAAPLVVVHPVLAREYPDDVRRAAAVGTRVLGDARANAGAETALAGPYLLNTIANLGVVAHEGDVDVLAGAFDGVPAIVVAAGPSLDRVIVDLVRLQHRALVIAVDTALRPLLAQGVAPHLAVAVDPSERNARHLSNLDDAGSTWLVAEPSVHPNALPAFTGRTFTFRVGDNHPWPWLASLGVRRGTLAAWGSVLVSALDLALRVGARPIAIVGADLAYTGGQPYGRGTAFEEDWAREVRHGSRLADVWARVAGRAGAQQQPDLHGLPVPTLPHLVAFRDHLRERIAGSGVRVVNATGGGILHGSGVAVGTLAEAFADTPPATDDLRTRLRGAHRRSVRAGHAGAATLRTALADAGTPRVLASLVAGVDADRVHASIARARAALAAAPSDAPIATAGAVPTALPVWLPEQAAALASLRDEAVARPVFDGDAAPPTAGDVIAAASALLAHTPLTAAPVDADALCADLLALPLPMLVPIAPDARAAADRLSALLTRWIAASPPTPPPDPYWHLAAPSVGPDRAVEVLADPEALARFAVVTTVAWSASRTGRADAAVGRLAARIAATGPPRPPRSADEPRVALTVALDGTPRLPWALAAPLAAYARPLAGTLFGAGDSPPPRPETGVTLGGALSLPEAGGSRQEWPLVPGAVARRLTPAHCEPCVFATVRDGRSALVSRLDLAGSYLVDAAGAVVDAPRWPRPILGEGRWDDGATFAWGHAPPHLLVRDASGVVTHDEALPFDPVGVETEGAGLRFAARNGVWRWTAASGAEHLVATPPLIATFAEPDGSLRLARLPVDRQPGETLAADLIWRRGEAPREAAPEPLGPCWSQSVADGWRADALPAADVVRVSGPGARGWIVCEAPRTVVWAGDALVVVLIGGTVLHVPDVRGRLAPR